LRGIDLDQNPAVKTAVFKILDQVRGTPQFVQIVRDFNIKGQDRELLAVALNNSTNSTGAEAIRLILANENLPLLKSGLDGSNAAVVAESVGNAHSKEALPLLAALVVDPASEAQARRAAVRALARTQDGAGALLHLVQQNKLPEPLKL